MNYFSVGNRIFTYNLTPAQLQIYCVLSSMKNQLSYVVSKIDVLSRKSGLSPRTVCRAIAGLEQAGLVSKRKRYRQDGGRASNGYLIATAGGGKFKIDRNIFKKSLDATSFSIYFFLTKVACNKTQQAFPSLNKIAAVLRLCKNTVISKIKLLERSNLIQKNHQLRQNGEFACNRHLLMPLLQIVCACMLNERENDEDALLTAKGDKKRKNPFSQRFFHQITRLIPQQPSKKLKNQSWITFSLMCEWLNFKRATAFLRKFTSWTHFFIKG